MISPVVKKMAGKITAGLDPSSAVDVSEILANVEVSVRKKNNNMVAFK